MRIKHYLLQAVLIITPLLTATSNAQPTEAQIRMMSEPVSMMDIFIERISRRMEKRYASVKLSPTSSAYPVKTKDNKALEISPDIGFSFDMDRGAWIASLSTLLIEISRPKPDLSTPNLKNICGTFIEKLNDFTFFNDDASHSGFSFPSYDTKKFPLLASNLIYAGQVLVLTRDGEAISVNCEKARSGTKVSYTYKE